MNNHPGILFRTPNSLAVLGFLDRYYRYKSIAIKIPHDTELISIPDTGQNSSPTGDSVESRVTKVPDIYDPWHISALAQGFVTISWISEELKKNRKENIGKGSVVTERRFPFSLKTIH